MKQIRTWLFFILFVVSCQKELNFDSVIVPGNGQAVFTLEGSPDTCQDLVSGNYIKNILLSSANTVTVGLNVSTAGSFTLSSNTVNGYSFTGSGNLSTGIQNIILIGSGTPVNPGSDLFTIKAGTSVCIFTVNVKADSAVRTDGNHFPLTTNSYWNYDDIFNPPDTIGRLVDDSIQIKGNFYKIFDEKDYFGKITPYVFRRRDSAYFEYGPVDKYTVSFKYLPAINADIPFLREYLATGDTWNSDEYIGPASFGQTIFFRYNFTCDDANASVTINGKTYSNVYKITMRPQIRSATTYPFNSTGEIRIFWFAKDVGMIYTKATDQGFILKELQIRNYHVY